MEPVRTLARACHAVPLVLLFTAGTAAAQMALSANGQQLNNLVGRGVALADLNGDGAIDLLAPVMPGRSGAAGIRRTCG